MKSVGAAVERGSNPDVHFEHEILIDPGSDAGHQIRDEVGRPTSFSNPTPGRLYGRRASRPGRHIDLELRTSAVA
jgi:hypothetical protein